MPVEKGAQAGKMEEQVNHTMAMLAAMQKKNGRKQ